MAATGTATVTLTLTFTVTAIATACGFFSGPEIHGINGVGAVCILSDTLIDYPWANSRLWRGFWIGLVPNEMRISTCLPARGVDSGIRSIDSNDMP